MYALEDMTPVIEGNKFKHKGYVMVERPLHPNNSNGYVPEHRLVMEYYLGRVLESAELIHHIDRLKDNNKLNNLQMMSRSEHTALHNKERKSYKQYDIDKVRDLYLQGYSTRKVADMMGMGSTSVARYVKELGISRPRVGKKYANGDLIKRR